MIAVGFGIGKWEKVATFTSFICFTLNSRKKLAVKLNFYSDFGNRLEFACSKKSASLNKFQHLPVNEHRSIPHFTSFSIPQNTVLSMNMT